jgi:murein DD-endopeptidase MepM/ murein hydrolase activator NlpD
MVIMGRPDRAPTRASRRAIALGTSVLCALALTTTSATAVPSAGDPGKEKRKVDAQVDSLKDRLDETSSDLADAYAALESTKNKLPAAQNVLARAQDAAEAADRANAVAEQELEAARASEAKAGKQLDTTTRKVADSRTRVAQFAAQIYQEQGFGQLDMALSSTDPQQFADRIALVDTVMDVQSESMERLSTEQASLTALEDHLSALRADSAEKQKKAAAALERAQGARDTAAKAKADLDQLAASQASQARTVAGKLARERADLTSMQAEQTRLQTILRQRAAEAKRRAAEAKRRAEAAARAQALAQARAEARAARAARAAARQHKKPSRHHAPSHSSGGGSSSSASSGNGGSSSGSGNTTRHGYLSPPSTAGYISSEFGMRFHPILHYWRLHSGRDYAIPCGTPVYAAASGTVIMSGFSGSYGNRVVIDHGIVAGEGLATTYNHLTSIKEYSGHVSRGQLIGYSGTTGRSTGCHLHFETLENGDFVDPRTWL